MNMLWTVLVPLAQQTPDPDDVKPGWLAFFVVLAMLVAIALLGLSLRNHLKKVNFEERRPDSRR